MATAAIFDLDRTLIAGSSAQVFGRMLNDVGIETPRAPGQSLYFKLYERFGEDPVIMRLARQSSRLFAGHRVATVEAAGLLAADVLINDVHPHARAEIERHRRSNAILVMATTSPSDLVWPLAQALGFDELICTRYASADGTYDGKIDGDYVWGAAKAAAVATWAGANGIDLTQSWAYSDSWYDVAMLELVGTPVAVNADARLRAMATARRWTVRDFEHPVGVHSLAGIEVQEALFPFFAPRLSVFANITLVDPSNVPETGPVIIAANHRSYFDPLALGYLGAHLRRPLRHLAKKEVLDTPVVGAVVAALGTIPVDRQAEPRPAVDSYESAVQALEAGEAVVILPQATIPRGEDFYRSDLRGKTGAVRLAKQTGAPIVPVGLWGTEQVWPRSSRLPRVTLGADRPNVQVVVGAPYQLSARAKPKPATAKLMKQIVSLLPAEAQIDKTPTIEEIALATPNS